MATNTRTKFIDSTSLLDPGQCQNELALGNYNPNVPQAGDTRIVLKAINPFFGFLYLEIFTAHNTWMPIPKTPPTLQMTVTTPSGPPAAVPLFSLPGHMLNHPHATAGGDIQGFLLLWSSGRLELVSTANTLMYIKHRERPEDGDYQLPDPNVVNGEQIQSVVWDMEIKLSGEED